MEVNKNFSIGRIDNTSNGKQNEIKKLNEEELNIFNVQDTEAAEGDSFVSSTSSSSSLEEIQAKKAKLEEELKELQEEREEKLEEIEKIEEKIEELADEAQKNIEEAIAVQEDAIKDHKEEANKVAKENIAAYVEANKQGGEGMTKDQLAANIQNAMPDAPDVADALAKLVTANEQINEIEELCGDLTSLINDVSTLDNLMDVKNQDIAEAAAEEERKCCDPIGFQLDDGTQYDFIVDDGNFDSTNDFLGADDQWAEMAALDTDGDNKVTAQEMQAGNIKAVKTDKSGNQSVVDIASTFGENFSIDLSSYTKGGSHSAIDTESDVNGNGIKDQTLLGTFNVNIDGQTVSGYNTLDDINWLNENYGLSTEAPAASEALESADNQNFSQEAIMHSGILKGFMDTLNMLKEQLSAAYEKLGITEETAKNIDESLQSEASTNVQNFFSEIKAEKEETEEDEKDKELEETKEETAA